MLRFHEQKKAGGFVVEKSLFAGKEDGVAQASCADGFIGMPLGLENFIDRVCCGMGWMEDMGGDARAVGEDCQFDGDIEFLIGHGRAPYVMDEKNFWGR